jgi:hypothetical protein
MNTPGGMPDLGTPGEVAGYLHSTVANLAQLRYLGRGPKFIKVGRKVLYRWSDVADWLDRNTIQRTDDSRG